MLPDLPQTYIGLLGLIVVAVGGAFAGIARWLHPRLDKVLNSIPTMIENEAKNKDILASMATSFAILSKIMTQQYASLSQQRRQIVIVEDNVIEARVVTHMCAEVAKKYKFSIIDVSSLAETYGLLSSAVVVILDVNLPDSTIDKLNVMINMSPCPVIIYSGDTYAKSDFPSAFRIISKNDKNVLEENIRQALESAIVESIKFS